MISGSSRRLIERGATQKVAAQTKRPPEGGQLDNLIQQRIFHRLPLAVLFEQIIKGLNCQGDATQLADMLGFKVIELSK
jgi:hypothetical protein